MHRCLKVIDTFRFSHIKAITGQRVVSTHSPYFAGQAQIEDLRLFIKKGGDTVSTRLDLSELQKTDDKRKLQDSVIESRGDILFSRAVLLFEGQTEEQALPIWAQKYWGSSIHELGFSFVRANGTDYFPFIWLAKNLNIPWYVIADGEAKPVGDLNAALKKAKQPEAAKCSNVVVLPAGSNFERQLLAEGYLPQVELALDEASGSTKCLDQYINRNNGLSYGKTKDGTAKGSRDYEGEEGRLRAAADAMKDAKTRLARPLARIISTLTDPARQFPSNIERLFEIISADHGIKKKGAKSP